MSVEQVQMFTCDSCGAKHIGNIPTGWLHETQPTRNTCKQCCKKLEPSVNLFNEDYFLRGKQTGVSLYEDYRWLPDLTIPMAKAIVKHCGIDHTDSILDFGCARGYVVKAFRQLDYCVYGLDISEWAITNADPEVANYVRCGRLGPNILVCDWIIAKDVLEHVHSLDECVEELLRCARKGVFIVVPLASESHNGYEVPEYELDMTHVHRLALDEWVAIFLRPGWAVTGQFRVPGVKDNYAQYERGNGFVTARRI